MFTHARLLAILFAILLVSALGCRSSRYERTTYERVPVESGSSGCCG